MPHTLQLELAERVALEALLRVSLPNRAIYTLDKGKSPFTSEAVPLHKVSQLSDAIKTLLDLLDFASAYVKTVVSGSTTPNPVIGRQIAQTLAAIPTHDPAHFADLSFVFALI